MIGREDDQFTDEATRELLELALHRDTGPFAPLLERLEMPDGDTWFNLAIVRVCDRAGIGAPEFDTTVRGLDALRKLKGFCRGEIEASRSDSARSDIPDSQRASQHADERRAEAFAGYALSVALAQALHGVMISGRSRGEWESIFLHLAELVAQPWSSHFHHASGAADG